MNSTSILRATYRSRLSPTFWQTFCASFRGPFRGNGDSLRWPGIRHKQKTNNGVNFDGQERMTEKCDNHTDGKEFSRRPKATGKPTTYFRKNQRASQSTVHLASTVVNNEEKKSGTFWTTERYSKKKTHSRDSERTF